MFSGATIVSSSVTSHACVKIRVVALTALIVTIVASIVKDHHGVPTAKGGTKLPTDRVPCIVIDNALFTGKRPEPEYIKKSPRADSIGSSVTSDVIAGNLGTKGDDPLEGLSASSI